MSTGETYQIRTEAAEIYESTFVPALFGEWATVLVERSGVAPGQAVLDVACGTGVVARAAADRMGRAGQVTGVDLNPAMLAVARRLRSDIDWRQADAAALDLPDGSFDVVLCQSGLMFFPDVVQALREMGRVAGRTARWASRSGTAGSRNPATPRSSRRRPGTRVRMRWVC